MGPGRRGGEVIGSFVFFVSVSLRYVAPLRRFCVVWAGARRRDGVFLWGRDGACGAARASWSLGVVNAALRGVMCLARGGGCVGLSAIGVRARPASQTRHTGRGAIQSSVRPCQCVCACP